MRTSQQSAEILQLEVYTQSRVISSEVCCPAGLRLLDILNEPVPHEPTVKADFLVVAELRARVYDDVLMPPPRQYVRKSAIQFAAVTDANAGRGAGAGDVPKARPYVRKSRATVSLELPDYTLIGTVHCDQGQTAPDVLNDGRPFLPLTDVVIACQEGFYGTRPFVAVNKQQVIWSREEPPG